MRFSWTILGLLLCFSMTAQEPLPPTPAYTVYFFLAEDCVICQQYTPLINELYEKFGSAKIHFLGLFPNKFSKTKTIAAFRETFNLKIPLQTDYFQTKAKWLQAKVTPEVFVVEMASQTILYSGRIDNTFYALGKRRRVTTSHELQEVLQAIQTDQPIEVPSTTSVGCFIQYHP